MKIAFRQGETRSEDNVARRPWRRGLTYGHVGDIGEWLAEVHLDIAIEEEDRSFSTRGFDRIIIAAPLWIRTAEGILIGSL
jgi:hypothetical protein